MTAAKASIFSYTYVNNLGV